MARTDIAVTNESDHRGGPWNASVLSFFAPTKCDESGCVPAGTGRLIEYQVILTSVPTYPQYPGKQRRLDECQAECACDCACT